MKTFLTSILFLIISYGTPVFGQDTESRLVALIAARHLNQETKKGIADLGLTSMFEDLVSRRGGNTWPSGHKVELNDNFVLIQVCRKRYEDLAKEIQNSGSPNLYARFFIQKKILLDKKATEKQRKEALFSLIRIVFNINLPLHVLGPKDEQKVKSRIDFNGQRTTLLSLWYNMIPGQKKTDLPRLAEQIDREMSERARQWQYTDPMRWIWENYQVTLKIIQESDTITHYDSNYISRNILFLNKRLGLAGIRLARTLNGIYLTGEAGIKPDDTIEFHAKPYKSK